LPGPAELREAMAVATGQLRPGAAWVDMTSCPPGLGLELMARARERGVDCLDAPTGGGPAAAEAASLQLFVGGQTETVERYRRLLEALGSIDHIGDLGAGYTTKLIVNLLWFGQAVAVGEALLLARRSGIDLDALRSVLGHSAADSEFIRSHVGALLDGDYLESFGLDRCCEELDATVELARELAVPFELSTHVQRCYRRALARYGAVDGELLAVALLEEQAGVSLRRDPDVIT
jgi:3-hydroxyisobutyrate dehydrogenase